jgi:outer membrane protein assembly factor BamA
MQNIRLRLRARKAHRLPPVLVFILAAAIRCLAAGGAAAAEPRFLIEKISIEGVKRHGAQAIIVSQSRLKIGQSYTERELQEAVYRVKHLPFVIGAELALRKGTERGRYELVVTVEETRPVFLDYSLAGGNTVNFPGSNQRFHVTWGNSGTLGLREFVGAGGLAFVAFSVQTGNFRTLQAGYTQYDLFGNASYASLTFASNLHAFHSSQLSFSGLLGIPLADNLTLTASPQWSGSDGPGTASSRGILGSLGLIYRTTDDPIIPTRGTDLELSIDDDHVYQKFTTTEFGTSRSSQNAYGLALSAVRYWPVTRRQSLGVSLDGSVFHQTDSGTFLGITDHAAASGANGELRLLYSASLWNSAATRRFGDLRFEASAGDAFQHSIGAALSPNAFANATELVADAGLVFRNEWGILRINLTYYGRVMPW